MNDKYILVGQTPVPCDDLMEWAQWFEENQPLCHVGQDHLHGHHVSTIFLGLDHNHRRHWMGDEAGPPILFETMVFCEHEPPCSLDLGGHRYATWTEAETGHQETVAFVRARMHSLKN